MNKNQNTLVSNNRYGQLMRIALIALVLVLFSCFAIAPSMSPIFAGVVNNGGATGGNTVIDDTAISGVIDIVIDVISTAALYIGIIIVLWGGFQIVLAFRREDSEGISKQITTVVVGGVLVGFGAIADSLYAALKGQ